MGGDGNEICRDEWSECNFCPSASVVCVCVLSGSTRCSEARVSWQSSINSI